jgi:hypothetical protein
MLRRLLPGFFCLLLGLFLTQRADAWKGGEAEASISGYRILHQTYRLNPDDPSRVDGILFDVAGEPAPLHVIVQLGEDGAWFNCWLPSTASLSLAAAECSVGGIALGSLQDLRVVATGG